MATDLSFSQKVQRFEANESRANTFVNGGEDETWTSSGGAVLPTLEKLIQDAQDEVALVVAAQLQSYSTLRAYRGSSDKVQIRDNLTFGTFYKDINDTTSLDNGGTVLVDILGRRWKRIYKDSVDVRWFGAKGDGVTDDTSSFSSAKDFLGSIGGGICSVPFGTYVLSNFIIDVESVIFRGETSGYGYSTLTSSVKLVPGNNANFVVRFKGAKPGVPINASAYSGLSNIQILCTKDACDYGVFIDSGATILENVVVQGFAYNCMCADQMNANIFSKCTFVAAKKVNFSVCEGTANSYINPLVTDITNWSNTTWEMDRCLFRQSQGFGVVFRSGVNVKFSGCGFESNDMAGLYIYRPDDASVRMLKLDNCWFENNYQSYTSGSTSYSVTGNRMFLAGNSNSYIAWSSLLQAGYQLVSDSQTRFGGGGDTFDFQSCSFVCAGTAQKAILILSGFKYDFKKCWFGGTGDIPNLIKVTQDAEAVHWYDPVAGNNPYATIDSLTGNFGENTGKNGAYFISGTSFGGGQLGANYPIVGVNGGPLHILKLAANDPRRTDPRLLDEYYEVDSFTIPWRTGNSTPFAISNENNSCTKIGREVTIKCKGTLTVTSTTSAADILFANATLPFQTSSVGNIVGQVVIRASGGSATVLNNGISPMEMNAIASTNSVVNVFPVLAVGMTFNYQIYLSYTTAT